MSPISAAARQITSTAAKQFEICVVGVKCHPALDKRQEAVPLVQGYHHHLYQTQ
jgi:hypothetical protein